MVHALAILLTSSLVVSVPYLVSGRMTPGDGLPRCYYGLIGILPVGAFVAGRRWHNGPVFLLYGAIGMMAFLCEFFEDYGLAWRYESGQSSRAIGYFKLTSAVVLVAVLCNAVGKLATNERSEPVSNGDSDSQAT